MRKLLLLIAALLFFNSFASGDTEQANYFALYFNDTRCGYDIQTRKVDGERVISTDNIVLELERMGTPIKIDVKETAIETIDGMPLSFKATQKISTMDMSVEGDITPDGKMRIRVTNAGNTQELVQDFPKGAVMTEGLNLLFKRQGLKKGTSYAADLFSPSTLMAMKFTFNVGDKKQVDLLGRVVELVEIKGEYFLLESGSALFTYYVDDDFNSQKMIMPLAGMNIEVIACSREFALSKLTVAEMVDSMVVRSPVAVDDPETAKEITYTLKPIKADASFRFPETDNQQVSKLPDGSVSVTVKPVKGEMAHKFPYTGNDPGILKALQGTQYIQTNHPLIKELSQRCTQDKDSALDAALAIEAFVSGYIEEKNLSVGYASALEVAKSRQGDCTEHAVLTAALCRAAGIPARVIMGIVHVENGLFMGHAWTEAYIGNKWIGLDAALKDARDGFDAGHITLSIGNGDAGDFFGVMNNLGNFTIQDVKITN
ncbi:MAG: transglutaminase domain-containing protein [Deltaproteobacteria bacterium]|nr:transglutaminase domain-containing protein [Deltaproteobacteria bacterium]